MLLHNSRILFNHFEKTENCEEEEFSSLHDLTFTLSVAQVTAVSYEEFKIEFGQTQSVVCQLHLISLRTCAVFIQLYI